MSGHKTIYSKYLAMFFLLALTLVGAFSLYSAFKPQSSPGILSMSDDLKLEFYQNDSEALAEALNAIEPSS